MKTENLSQLWSKGDVMAEEGSERGNIAGFKNVGLGKGDTRAKECG